MFFLLLISLVNAKTNFVAGLKTYANNGIELIKQALLEGKNAGGKNLLIKYLPPQKKIFILLLFTNSRALNPTLLI